MKTIFITGGAAGIGRAAVKKFLKEGWNVSFMDLDKESGEDLLRELNSDKVVFTAGDTRNREDLKRAVEATLSRFGAIHSVFANAGIHQTNTLLDISDEDLERIVSINIFGTVYTLQAVVPEIEKAGGGSVVINCSDQWYVGKPNSFAYGMTKGAVGQITRSLSIDLGPKNIRVNAVCGGSIDTPLLHGALERASKRTGIPYEELVEEENRLYFRGKVGQPEEVANVVYFLASDDSSFCTGGHFIVDGGLVAR